MQTTKKAIRYKNIGNSLPVFSNSEKKESEKL